MITRSTVSHGLRYSLVLVFFTFAYMKFFAYEARDLVPLLTSHPLLVWLRPVFGPRGASAFLGVSEIVIGLLIALGTWSPRLSALGAAMGMFAFIVTVTMFFFLPNELLWEPSAGGFPALASLGGFLFKDVVLFFACLACLADSLDAAKRESASTPA